MIRLYGVPSCNKIKNTRTLLEDNNIEFRFISVKKEPFAAEALKQVTQKLGLDNVVNRRGTTYRKLGLSGSEPDGETLFKLLLENQSMIKRPLLEKDGKWHVGYDEEAILKFCTS